GIRILLDGVFNHVGRGHPAFARAVEGGPERDLFVLDPATGEPAVFEGHGSLVELNHESQAVVDLVVEVMLHWLRRGISGWRLDAAYDVVPSFWANVLSRVRSE